MYGMHGGREVGGYEPQMYSGGFPAGGYGQMTAGYGADGLPPQASGDANQASATPGMYGGPADTYPYSQGGINPMYQMLYTGQGGQGGPGDPNANMYYAAMNAGAAAGAAGAMFNPAMGMGMGGPMGMNVGMGMGGYGPMGAAVGEDGKLVDQFASMGVSSEEGGKGKRGGGGGSGRGGDGSWAEVAKQPGQGRGRGGGRGYMDGMDARGRGYGRGRGGSGGGGGMGGFDDARKRDEERDRERARNGVRGLRSGLGGMGTGGPGNAVSAEVMRIKETLDPPTFDSNPKFARFFIIKSYSEDDVHKSIKYGLWASTDTGNRRLDTAYREMVNKGPIYLFFSVNASGQFSGMAQMESSIDYTKKFGCWAQDKWSGTFAIKWLFIKDIPNSQYRHILLTNNENKPVTNSRDTQEVMLDPGREMLRIFHQFKGKTSILDDFGFYDKRQELMEQRSQMAQGIPPPPPVGLPHLVGLPVQQMPAQLAGTHSNLPHNAFPGGPHSSLPHNAFPGAPVL